MSNPARERGRVTLLCFLTDLLIFWVALNSATLTRLHTLPFADLMLLQRDRVFCMLLFATAMTFAGAYNATTMNDRFDSLYAATVGLLVTGVLEFLFVALLPRGWLAISRRELGLAVIFAALPLGLWRIIATSLVTRFRSLHQTLYVFGDKREGTRIANEIGQSTGDTVSASYVEVDAPPPELLVGTAKPSSDAIICLMDGEHGKLHSLLEFCETHCRRTFLFPGVHDTYLFQQRSMIAIGGVPLIELAKLSPTGPYVMVKRAVDLVVAVLALILSAPVCLISALAIVTTSRGGTFHVQERVGKDGRVFNICKFRTMVANAEQDAGPVWARENDARVTRVGRILRRHRIDEIPQLVNVIKGDMSLVGPRPERPAFHKAFLKEMPLFRQRLVLRPGITSLSHVLGSYGSDPADRLRYDLNYIANISLFNDLKILAATVRVVLGAKGAR